MHIFEGIRGVAGHLCERAGIQAKGQRTLTVHITNGTSTVMNLVGEPYTNCGECAVSFATLASGQTGTISFATKQGETSAMHGGAVELSFADASESVFVGESNPLIRQASFVIQYKTPKGPANPKDFWRNMPRKFLGRVGDDSCVETASSVAHVQDVTYDQNFSNCPNGVDVLFTDACGEAEEELQGILDLNSPGFLGLLTACGRDSFALLGHAVFLAEFSAVRGMFLHASLQDRAFALDLLIHGFLLRGAVDVPRETLGGNLRRWERECRPGELAANQLPEYASYKGLDIAAGLPEYVSAGMALCRAAIHHSSRAIRSVVAKCKENNNWPPTERASMALPSDGIDGIAHGPRVPQNTVMLREAFRKSTEHRFESLAEDEVEDAEEAEQPAGGATPRAVGRAAATAPVTRMQVRVAPPDDPRSDALHAVLTKVCETMRDRVAYENGSEEAFNQLRKELHRMPPPKKSDGGGPEPQSSLLVQSLESAPCDAGVVWAFLVQIAGKRKTVQRIIADIMKMLLTSRRWQAALRANPAVMDAPVPTVVHDVLQQALAAKEEASERVTQSEAIFGRRSTDSIAEDVPLQELVRMCMGTLADHGIQRNVFVNRLAKHLLKQYRSAEAHDALRHYQAWIPLAQRRFLREKSERVPTLRFESFGLDVFSNIAGVGLLEKLKGSLGESSLDYVSITTNSKSGEFFFFSGDFRFLVKTISSKEASVLQHMLPAYQAYIRECPDSWLVRFAGLVRFEVPEMPSRFFIVMSNVFEGAPKMHDTFDLKGSMYSRKKKEGESIGKDQDWFDSGQRLCLDEVTRRRFCEVHEKDVEFLLSHRVMDYSMLVGIHRPVQVSEDVEVDPDEAAAVAAARRGDLPSALVGEDGTLYFVGIIDFLIEYGFRKRTENILHIMKGHADDASCVPPDQYGERQVQFLRESVMSVVPETSDPGTAGLLTVDVVRGEQMLPCDATGTSDPYVCVTLGLVSKRTPVIMKTLSPRWDCTLCLPVNESHLDKELCLTVWDRDEVKMLRGSDDFMGVIRIPMRRVVSQRVPRETCTQLQDVAQGSLVYRLNFSPLASMQQR